MQLSSTIVKTWKQKPKCRQIHQYAVAYKTVEYYAALRRAAQNMQFATTCMEMKDNIGNKYAK